MIKNTGNTDSIISEYLKINSESIEAFREFNDQNSDTYFKKISVRPENANIPSSEIEVLKSFTVVFN